MKKIPLTLLLALVGLPQISETIYTPALPKIASALQTSPSLIELTLSIYFVGFALGVAVWGALSDKWGRKPCMLLGLLLYSLSTFLCGKVGDVSQLIALRLFQAFGASVGSVLTQTILRDLYTGEERTKIFATLIGALALSPALGPLCGGVISEQLGWRINFFFLTLCGALICFWALKKLPETLNSSVVQKCSVKKILSTKTLWGHIALIGATNGALFGFYQEAPFLYIEKLGFSQTQYGLFGLLIAFTTLLSAKLSPLLSEGKPIYLGVSLMVTGSLLYFFSSAALFLLFLGIGFIIPRSLSSALKPFAESLGKAGSVFGGLYYLLIALCTALMSALHGSILSLPCFFLLMSLLGIFGSLIVTKREVRYIW